MKMLIIALAALELIVEPAASAETVKKISFILTNDIHGHLQPVQKNREYEGGLAYFSTIVKSTRAKKEYASGEAALFVLDAGDQFQGTLLSNFDEGLPIFKAFNEIGYDAIVPGNHDYDFGPLGWLEDQVTDQNRNPKRDTRREVIEGLTAIARFPLLSANTYYKNSIKTSAGDAVPLTDECLPKDSTPKDPLDFSKAVNPEFLRPYVILERAGVRVALIGLDHHNTSSVTTYANVSDLCFRDEVATYLTIRKALEGKADIFVLMMHNGDTDKSLEASNIVKAINSAIPNGVHLAVAGHTHFEHSNRVGDVRVVQNGAEGKKFGSVDLFFDTETRTVLSKQTISKVLPIDSAHRLPDPAIDAIIDETHKRMEVQVGNPVLATVRETIGRDRINENALGNIVTDGLRLSTGTDVAFYNSGGVRVDLYEGPLTYEKFFEVLPFGNRAVVIKDVTVDSLERILLSSLSSCGNRGILNVSGIRVEFSRTCGRDPANGQRDDDQAKILKITRNDGRVLLDYTGGTRIDCGCKVSVATVDYVAKGGEGYSEFGNYPVQEERGLVRDLVSKHLEKTKPELTNTLDGRLKNKADPKFGSAPIHSVIKTDY